MLDRSNILGVFLTSPGAIYSRTGQPFIDVWDWRAYVARCRFTARVVIIEHAINAGQLEIAARAAISAQGRLIIHNTFYPCPPELAARARWPSRWQKEQ